MRIANRYRHKAVPVATFFLERPVDILLLIGIVVLVLALLGIGGLIEALASIAWVLLILAVIVIAWRVIVGRRPV